MGTNRRPKRVSNTIRTATVALVIGLAAACGTQSRPQSDPSTLTTSGATSETTTSEPSTTVPTTSSSTPEAVSDPLHGLPALWPFSTLAEARQWQAQGEGHSPWHLDAEATAVFFTTGYLGFAGVDKVLDSQITATEAKVTVGYQGDLPEPAPAATLHLVRFGEGQKAPWQVVGTVDTSFTITSPAPNAKVTSPVKVSGQIDGLDESIEVQVRDPDLPAPVGKSCCQPAGGENAPWSATVPFEVASNTTLTIVAATGGHAADVERFAVTGVRLAG